MQNWTQNLIHTKNKQTDIEILSMIRSKKLYAIFHFRENKKLEKALRIYWQKNLLQKAILTTSSTL